MLEKDQEITQIICQQYESFPYPDKPINEPLNLSINDLFWENITTIFYLANKEVINPEGKCLLDAGCGTGWQSLKFAKANPQVQITGIDISPKSIELAKQRFQYHGIKTGNFFSSSIENLSQLELKFDYINCDQVLFFLPDVVLALKSLKSVLKPTGIIRANLHNYYQRLPLYRIQNAFKIMGLLDNNPGEFEIEIALEIMENLKDNIEVKNQLWQQTENANNKIKKEFLLRDFLVQGDKGFTIPEMFACLKKAELQFIKMVNWQQWEFLDLFKDSDNPLASLAFILPEMSEEEQLHLFQLFQPIHRLLDFWCCHPENKINEISTEKWQSANWKTVKFYLHPLLKNSQFKEDLNISFQQQKSLNLTNYLSATSDQPLIIENQAIDCLLALHDHERTLEYLSQRWLSIEKIDDTNNSEEVTKNMLQLLNILENKLFILVQC